MANQITRIAILTTVIFLFAFGFLENAIAANCTNTLDADRTTGPELIQCLIEMNSEIDTLKTKLAPFLNAKGAVLAFDRSEENDGGVCPQGWTLFDPGAGRFIIGVGATKDTRGETRKFAAGEIAGEYMNLLTEAEMPRHDHGGIFGTDGSRPRATNDHRRETAHSTIQISPDGGSKPHNNMPPYVALYFCKKSAN